jgi:hypothetical protein
MRKASGPEYRNSRWNAFRMGAGEPAPPALLVYREIGGTAFLLR